MSRRYERNERNRMMYRRTDGPFLPLCAQSTTPSYHPGVLKSELTDKDTSQTKVPTLRDDDSGCHERFFNMRKFEVAVLRKVCGVAVTHLMWLFVRDYRCRPNLTNLVVLSWYTTKTSIRLARPAKRTTEARTFIRHCGRGDNHIGIVFVFQSLAEHAHVQAT